MKVKNANLLEYTDWKSMEKQEKMPYASPVIREIELEADRCILSASSEPLEYGQSYENDMFD